MNWSFLFSPVRLGANGGFSEDKTGKYRLDKDDLLIDNIPAGISVSNLAATVPALLKQRKSVWMLYHGCYIVALKQEPIENFEHQVFSRPAPFTKRKLKMKNIYLAAIGLISFMLYFNLTIAAFMKSSALYADEKNDLMEKCS